MSDKVGLILDLDQTRRERDEARAACWEIIDSLCATLPHATAESVWARCVRKWPWLKDETKKHQP